MTEIVLFAIAVAILATATYGLMKFFETMFKLDRAKARWLLVQDINTGQKQWIGVKALPAISREVEVLEYSRTEPNSEWLDTQRTSNKKS